MMKKRFQPVVFQPRTYQGMQSGINQLVAAVRPTLGPLPRIVGVERTSRERTPELLDNGATIARRIIQLPERDADVGAMFLRQVLWQVHEQVGDGTATTAVLFESVFNHGVRYVAAGGNPMRLRHYLEEGLRVICAELSKMAQPLEGKGLLVQMAESICYDAPLARMLGEVLDIIGEYGQLDIRSGRGRELERQYIEGMYWNSSLVSRQMITDRKQLRAELQNPALLISDLDLENPHDVVPVLELVHRAGLPGLIVIAGKVSASVTGLLVAASRDAEKFRAIAVKTPGGTGTAQAAALEDLAILTGGRRVLKTAGDTLAGVGLEDLGGARRAWADQNYFGIVGGKGDPRRLRTHIANLRVAFQHADGGETRKGLRERIGKLLGGSAVLFVAGATEAEIETRKEMAGRTADTLRAAVREGVVPGGGVAFLACRPALAQRLAENTDTDACASYRILIGAIEAPTRAIVKNAGYDPGAALAAVDQAGAGYGFDVRSGQVVDMAREGIWDAVAVLKTAAHSAIASAALALTTDVLVHHKKPQQMTKP